MLFTQKELQISFPLYNGFLNRCVFYGTYCMCGCDHGVATAAVETLDLVLFLTHHTSHFWDNMIYHRSNCPTVWLIDWLFQIKITINSLNCYLIQWTPVLVTSCNNARGSAIRWKCNCSTVSWYKKYCYYL